MERLVLEPEQEALLIMVVEAHRNASKEVRQRFLVVRTSQGVDVLMHPSLPGNRKIYQGDAEALIHEGLLRPSYNRKGGLLFDITPQGFKYYEFLRTAGGRPIKQMESAVKSYLEDQVFRERHTEAYQRWSQAEAKLWISESEKELTTIGHLCREAMQFFAESLAVCHKVDVSNKEPAQIIARLRAVLEVRGAALGTTIRPVLDALLTYWGTVNDLVQRQEHGALREGERLVWHDGRRVVFLTMTVMHEIDSALS